jgi:hypothetical protein
MLQKLALKEPILGHYRTIMKTGYYNLEMTDVDTVKKDLLKFSALPLMLELIT